MKITGLLLLLWICGLSACATKPASFDAPANAIRDGLASAHQSKSASPTAEEAAALRAALAPPAHLDIQPVPVKIAEPHFDLVVNNAPAAQVLLGIVSGTRYSMLLPPDLAGTISMNLRDVTVPEALSALRQIYGYEYRIEGNRIFILPQTMQTRVLQVSYLDLQRRANSEIRVISGSVSDVSGGNGGQQGQQQGNQQVQQPGQNNSTNPGQNNGSSGGNFVSSRISTSSKSDFWTELSAALKAIVGEVDGRRVVISPQTGIIVVRAMPAEISNVELYLRAAKISLERQVILEAKILEVQLNNDYQSGINWAAFGHLKNNTGDNLSVGSLQPGVSTGNNTPMNGTPLSGTAGSSIANSVGSAASLFGLVFQSNSFTAVLSMLEQQGKVHVLSSPRISSLNNQSAVLKVGTDDFFVTNVSTTTTTGTATTSTPNVTLQPFFSGISLDVTPVIDDERNITLHVHPSVSQVTTVSQTIDLGSQGSLVLPLASSNISETDSIVRGRDGQIIALGGLIRESLSDTTDQVPVLGGVPIIGNLFRNTGKTMQRRELVILIKPTIVEDGLAWNEDLARNENSMKMLLEQDNLRIGK